MLLLLDLMSYREPWLHNPFLNIITPNTDSDETEVASSTKTEHFAQYNKIRINHAGKCQHFLSLGKLESLPLITSLRRDMKLGNSSEKGDNFPSTTRSLS